MRNETLIIDRAANGSSPDGGKPHSEFRSRPTLITGGAGFIGTNVAHRLLSQGHRVLVFDNLSRAGVEQNLEWLQQTHGDAVTVEIADVRNLESVSRAVAASRQVFHFAAQVAVTSSLTDPLHDFEVNARGTLNVLEAMRGLQAEGRPVPSLLFTSTNKVYGGLDDIDLRLQGDRYEPRSDIREAGISEMRRLDFHSPYGCSKGAADQYVFDYARTFGLPAVVFRMSCIYGPHQFGTEDQGWVAHFLLRALAGRPITIYGDGRQVRDILFVDDLVDAMLLAQENMATLAGSAFNIGGSAAHTISLLELLDLMGELTGQRIRARYEDWRPGDQRYYVSDTSKFQAATNWAPSVGVAEGVRALYKWMVDNEVPARTGFHAQANGVPLTVGA